MTNIYSVDYYKVFIFIKISENFISSALFCLEKCIVVRPAVIREKQMCNCNRGPKDMPGAAVYER